MVFFAIYDSQHVANALSSDCNQCPYAQCIAADSENATSTSSSKGVSKGAVAAAVVVTILVLAASVAAYFWYRRRQRLQQQNTASEQEGKSDVPARAEDVLNRPDPNEKPTSPPPQSPAPQLNSVRIYSGTLHGTINLDPAASDAGPTSSSMSVHSNPDRKSTRLNSSHSGESRMPSSA